MKNNLKWIVCVLIFAVIMPLCSVMFLSAPQKNILNIQVFADQDIINVSADYTDYEIENENDAWEMLEEMRATFGYSSVRSSLSFESKSSTAAGTIYRFSQVHGGLRLYASHLDISVGKNKKVKSITGKYYFNLFFDEDASYGINEAKAELGKTYDGEATLEEEVYFKDQEEAYKVYIFSVESGTKTRRVFVSARTGVIIQSEETSSALRQSLPSTRNYNVENVGTAQTDLNNQSVTLNVDKYTSKSGGQSFYVLGNSERRIYVVDGGYQESFTGFQYIDSENGVFADQVAVQAYEYLMKCYDYYLEGDFGESIEGMYNFYKRRITLIGIVHYGQNWQNAAFYIPEKNSLTGYFLFGDGGGYLGGRNSTTFYAKALDVVAHEYQHSINNAKAGLTGIGQTGAINEAIADIFGAVIEGKDMSKDAGFWRMGEDVYVSSGFMRDMSNPSPYGDASHYSELKLISDKEANESNDNGYVHQNSTLLTYAAYLMYKNDPEFFNEQRMTELWYATLCMLKENETFQSFANYMYQAAQNLDWPQQRVADVYKALSDVGIPGFEGQKIWGGYSLTTLEGLGTSISPYLIKTTDDLASVMYYVNDPESDIGYTMKSYQLSKDITLPSNVPWEGIGTKDRPFNGTFTGGGHAITGLNLNNEQTLYNGLFAYVGGGGYIGDIIVKGNTSSSAEYTGGIVGRLEGVLSGCGSELELDGKKVGGLVGLAINSTGGQIISGCYFNGTLSGELVGGLAAQFVTQKDEDENIHLAGYVSSCYAIGRLTGKIVGGLVGVANGLMLVNDIVAADIVGANGAQALGGMVGQLYFLNPLAERETAVQKVTNYFISCLSTADFIDAGGALVGSVYASNLGAVNDGLIYLEKVTVKARDNIDYTSDGLDKGNIKVAVIKTSTDAIFEGDFDFDNPSFYKNDDIFTFLVGNDAFNMSVDFSVVQNKMPTFTSLSTWYSFVAGMFDGGTGSKENPYKISTPEQLVTLSAVTISGISQYSYAYYQLVNDIDLGGRVWPGIGGSVSVYDDSDYATQREQTSLNPFMGSFDGAGHTIRNMTSIGLYTGENLSSDGKVYTTTNFSAGLFGLTASHNGYTPTIKNLTLENVNVRGGRAGAVVSVAYGAINLENVTVSGGVISASYAAGGLISTMYGIEGSQTSSKIINCSVNASVSGVVAGGAVGYATNPDEQGDLEIINLLVQGKVLVSGNPLESTGERLNPIYRRAIGGGVFGVLTLASTSMINSLVLCDVVAYSREAYIGGFVGAIGEQDNYSTTQIDISISGGKLTGRAYYIFDSSSTSAGSILGSNHLLSMANINLAVDDKTYINSSNDYVYNNQMNAVVTSGCNPVVSQDELGEEGGDFDIYSTDYYSNLKYFDTENAWQSEQQDRLYIVITLLDWDGSLLASYKLEIGEKLDLSQIKTPSRGDTVAIDYSFRGWSHPLENIHSSMTVYAEYVGEIRYYEVQYWAEGTLVESKDVNYGSTIPQDVEAPEKKGNFFVRYEFARWGEEGTTVGGNLRVEAIYKAKLSSGSIALIVVGALLVVGAVGFVFLRRSRRSGLDF